MLDERINQLNPQYRSVRVDFLSKCLKDIIKWDNLIK